MSRYLIPQLLLFYAVLGLISGNSFAPQKKIPGEINPAQHHSIMNSGIVPGASRIDVYLPLLKNKKLGVFANQTSMIGNTHLVDTLLKLGVTITVIFGPEHGFRGTADAGEKIGNYTDQRTGIPVISLYGNKRRPSAEDLANVDIMLFDIQDVGVRFYTFISSLEDYMESALVYGKPLLILDRPNPNGFYVDGPVLEPAFRSFIGMQPVPVVYGMTIGEYAMMIAGEKWLSEKANAKFDYYRTAKNSADTPFHFLVIKCGNYTHQTKYELPVKPSPNLPEMQSVYLYPSTCFFEGTVLSEGRGTPTPFQVFGHPSLPKSLYTFTPVSTDGAKDPKLKNQSCYGWNLSGSISDVLKIIDSRIQLSYLIKAFTMFPEKEKFFLPAKSGKIEDHYFNKLAGNSTLMGQLKNGATEEQIRKSWEPQLSKFRKIRKKYLMYPD
jgi:uncharacterized protein YbbC (DUF1343 family)